MRISSHKKRKPEKKIMETLTLILSGLIMIKYKIKFYFSTAFVTYASPCMKIAHQKSMKTWEIGVMPKASAMLKEMFFGHSSVKC